MSNISFSAHTMMLQNKLRVHNNSFNVANQRLATGSRINEAKDDPYRNYEASKMENDIKSKERAKHNAADGASLLQIAEGTCNEVQSILHRIRELSVQSANDTLTSTERYYLNEESSALLKEIDRIAETTTYNKKMLFGKRENSVSDEERNLVDWSPFSGARDADGNTKVKIGTDPATGEDIFGEKDIRVGVLHIGSGATAVDEVKVSLPEVSAKSLGLDTLSITYQNGATKAIDDLDAAIGALGLMRSYMGVLVNSMDKQVEDLSDINIGQNQYIAQIKDADIAKESTAFMASQIQQQAAISILAQTNSRVGRVLEMLAR